MENQKKLHIELQGDNAVNIDPAYNFDRIIYDLESDIDLLSSNADKLDYLVSIGSGLLSGCLDIFWVEGFNLERGRNIASDEVDGFVVKSAKLLGYKEDDLKGAVGFLEKHYHIPSDGNTPDFGGGLQHHLRDFAHHPTIVGLMFSLLTQFTHKSYGTATDGSFLIKDVTDNSTAFIGKDVPTKIFYGTFKWFFHLVSDMAGSNSTVGKSGGTGIPGPLLSLIKELSALPFFKELNVGDHSLSKFLSKLYNGTLLAKRDEAGRIIKNGELRFDLRGEMGLGIEIGRQGVPVVANECMVRSFYFIRRLAVEIKERDIRSLKEAQEIEWNNVRPHNNPTIARMLTIATGVFTTIDVGEALITQKYWVSVNYIGVGRFAVAIGEDVAWFLKAGDLKRIKKMYEKIQRFAFEQKDDNIYKRIGADMNMEKMGLTVEQTKILYNLEYHKTLQDIQNTKFTVNNEKIKDLKKQWLDEWKVFISKGFSSFLQIDGVEMNWYGKEELMQKIEENQPEKVWFRLVLLEAMLFTPYYPLGIEEDKNGKNIPIRKYKGLQNSINGYKKGFGDDFLESFFTGSYYEKGYIKRLRKTYDKSIRELKEVQKTVIRNLFIASIIAIATIATAGVAAPKIAVALVGSNFAGLKGAALTSACLAYLGGGAVAFGGGGMMGGTMVIVGGGGILGCGVGAGVGGAAATISLKGKENTILQSAKLLVSVREIFLNDEKDMLYSDTVYEQYVEDIMAIEKGLVELKHRKEEAQEDEKKELQREIKRAEESVKAMKIAKRNLRKFMSSFEEGLAQVTE